MEPTMWVPKGPAWILDRDRSQCYDRLMGKTDAERKQAERDRKADQGLKRYEVWLHPSMWPAVRQYIARLRSSASVSKGK